MGRLVPQTNHAPKPWTRHVYRFPTRSEYPIGFICFHQRRTEFPRSTLGPVSPARIARPIQPLQPRAAPGAIETPDAATESHDHGSLNSAVPLVALARIRGRPIVLGLRLLAHLNHVCTQPSGLHDRVDRADPSCALHRVDCVALARDVALGLESCIEQGSLELIGARAGTSAHLPDSRILGRARALRG